MSFDAAQILRQTYAAGAEAAQMREMAEPVRAPVVEARGELMGSAFMVEANPMAELMDAMEELSFQFEEKEAKQVGERKMGEMQGPRSALIRAVENWMGTLPDMPGREFLSNVLRNLRGAAAAGQARSGSAGSAGANPAAAAARPASPPGGPGPAASAWRRAS